MDPDPQTPAAASRLTLRHSLNDADLAALRHLLDATAMFSSAEIAIALELADAFLRQGDASGYRFTLADLDGAIRGYACFGPTPCTLASHDLYWIAVHPSAQQRGIGRRLLADVEQRIAADGGRRLYVDTSGRDAYVPTRAFYERMGYVRAALLTDFYGPGDAKVIYLKVL